MRVLVISRTAWRKDNSFGNTYSNIFGGMENVEIANLYLGDGLPDLDNDNVISYYQISEKEALASVFTRKETGRELTEYEISQNNSKGDSGAYRKAITGAKRMRFPFLFIMREIAWKMSHVDYDGLISYIQAFHPDIIFLSFYYAAYVDRISLEIKKRVDLPMVLEAAIDIYSLRQLSLDPMFWINRLNIRRMIRKTVRVSEKLYVISEKMRNDYEKMLGITCGVLYKFPDRSRRLYDYRPSNKPYVLLFTGNIGSNRWKSLAALGTAVKEKGIGTVKIYTATPLTKSMIHSLKDCIVHPAISSKEVVMEQNNADILLHVESFYLKDRLEARYSISTKIMDYLSTCRCILAISPKGMASTEFLRERDLAIVCDDIKEISACLDMIKSSPEILSVYARKIKEYLETVPSKEEMQKMLYDDMQSIIEQYRKKHDGNREDSHRSSDVV